MKFRRRMALFRTVAITAAAVVGVLGREVVAQQTVVIGGSGRPAVEVNLGALDQIGRAPGGGDRLPPPLVAPRSQLLVAPVATSGITPLQNFTVAPIPAAQPIQPVATAIPSAIPAVPTPEPAAPVVVTPAPEPVAEPWTKSEVDVAEIPVPEIPSESTMPTEPQETVIVIPESTEQEAAAIATVAGISIPLTNVPAAPSLPDLLRIEYDSESVDFPAAVEAELRTIASALNASETIRAQVKAYASGASGSASAARRLSLSRALAVRSFLIGEGVRSTRIDVRALGNKSEGGPPERVDVLLVTR